MSDRDELRAEMANELESADSMARGCISWEELAEALLDGPLMETLRLARIGAWVEQHEWPHAAPSGEYRLCARAAGAPVESPTGGEG
jgi:hypothetical protein